MQITYKWILERTNNCLSDCKKTGVYKIWHIEKPKVFYIGSASSTSKEGGFIKRWKSHIRNLIKKEHPSIYFMNVVNKYGIDGIRFGIIEFTEPYSCIKQEQYWLDLLKPFNSNGYNTCRTAGSTLGIKIPIEKRKNCKKIYKYDLKGNLLCSYYSLQEAARQTGIQINCIMYSAKKKIIQGGGYIWRYKKEKIDTNFGNRLYYIACYYNGIFQYKAKSTEILNMPGMDTYKLYDCIRKNKTKTINGWLFRKYEDNIPKNIPYEKILSYTYKLNGENIKTLSKLCEQLNVHRRYFCKSFKNIDIIKWNGNIIERIKS